MAGCQRKTYFKSHAETQSNIDAEITSEQTIAKYSGYVESEAIDYDGTQLSYAAATASS